MLGDVADVAPANQGELVKVVWDVPTDPALVQNLPVECPGFPCKPLDLEARSVVEDIPRIVGQPRSIAGHTNPKKKAPALPGVVLARPKAGTRHREQQGPARMLSLTPTNASASILPPIPKQGKREVAQRLSRWVGA